MSHLVEVYAKDLGVKIGKAQLINHYFPIGTDNYIVMSSQSPIQSNQYDYWDVVFHILNPILNRNKINVIDLTSLEATPNQKNYIIKNSKGFLGHLDHYSLIADIYNIPNVSIIGNTYPETNKPENAKVLAPDFSEIKPSFSAKEGKKRINEILPEIIASYFLEKINIKTKINFKTKRIGHEFQNELVEVVPDFFAYSQELENKPINIRADLCFDEMSIMNWCQMSYVNLFTDKILDFEIIENCEKLKQVIFLHKGNHSKDDMHKFFKILKKRRINIVIANESEDNLSDLRLEFFEYAVSPSRVKNEDPKATKFLSKKRFVTKENVYPSESSAKRLDKSHKFVYDEISSKELENFYLYE